MSSSLLSSSTTPSSSASSSAPSSSLVPYHAAFATPAARQGTELQSFLHDEALGLLRTVFPRLQRGFIRKHMRTPRVECLMLLASGGDAVRGDAQPPTTLRRAVSRAAAPGDDGDDSDPLDVLDENSDDVVCVTIHVGSCMVWWGRAEAGVGVGSCRWSGA